MNPYQTLLISALQENQVVLDEAKQQSLINYLIGLQKWNNVFNLTTITSPKEMVYLHLIDSLIIEPYLYGQHFLDVGSGAGLPGIPLAIANPTQEWVVLDKNSKKTRFLTQIAAELKLINVSVVHSRCENFSPNKRFDSILSRAFGSLSLFVETTRHLLNPNGYLMAMKGHYPHDELNDLPSDAVVDKIIELKLKGIDVTRHLVCIKVTN